MIGRRSRIIHLEGVGLMKRKLSFIVLAMLLVITLSSCGNIFTKQDTNNNPTTDNNYTQENTDTTNATIQDYYFATAKTKAVMIDGSKALSRQQAKKLIISQVDEHWTLLKNTFAFTNKDQAYAFLIGMATRESTLQAGLETAGSQVETGNNPSHAFGALQCAEPAYQNNKGYTKEADVPEMTQYQLLNKNFYDPGVAVHMGIRHLVHFALAAKKINKTGNDLLRYSLIGYNTGHVDQPVDPKWMKEYADEIGALAGWYLKENHLSDDVFTWTGDARVDRANPWGWYK